MRRFGSLGRRPSPAMVVSIIALVMATAGTATAARVLIKSSGQISKGAVNSGDVADDSLRGKDIRDGTIELGELEASARAAISASQTAATEVFRKVGPTDVPRGTEQTIASIASLEPGVYAIFSKTVLTAPEGEPDLIGSENGAGAHCILRANEDRDESRGLIAVPGYDTPGQFHNQITATLNSPSKVELACDSPDREWRATDTTIIALRVSKAPRQSVDG